MTTTVNFENVLVSRAKYNKELSELFHAGEEKAIELSKIVDCIRNVSSRNEGAWMVKHLIGLAVPPEDVIVQKRVKIS